jgi:hypothetical protein
MGKRRAFSAQQPLAQAAANNSCALPDELEGLRGTHIANTNKCMKMQTGHPLRILESTGMPRIDAIRRAQMPGE